MPFLKFEVEADDLLTLQLHLCLAVLFGFSSLFTAVYSKNYSVQHISKLIKRHKYTKSAKLVGKLEIARMPFLVPNVLPRKIR